MRDDTHTHRASVTVAAEATGVRGRDRRAEGPGFTTIPSLKP
jgi:hypothetical protein